MMIRRPLSIFALGLALSVAGAHPGGAGAATSTAAPSAEDTDFLFQLGILEGHLIVGHDLLKAGKPQMALPHFGHPVHEIYGDIADYLTEKKITGFDTRLIRLEAAVASDPDSAATEALYQQTIQAVHEARMTAPAALRDSVPAMIKICSDTVDAAAGEYSTAVEQGRIAAIVEYHDSRGYLAAAAQQVEKLRQQNPDDVDQNRLTRFQTVLAKAQWIVEPLIPPAPPRATPAEYRDVAAQAAQVARQ
jgi:hypothetical protein